MFAYSTFGGATATDQIFVLKRQKLSPGYHTPELDGA